MMSIKEMWKEEDCCLSCSALAVACAPLMLSAILTPICCCFTYGIALPIGGCLLSLCGMKEIFDCIGALRSFLPF